MKDDWPHTLWQKELTRKEFLQFIAAAVVMVLGISNLINLAKQTAKSPPAVDAQASDSSHGFGSRKFGA